MRILYLALLFIVLNANAGIAQQDSSGFYSVIARIAVPQKVQSDDKGFKQNADEKNIFSVDSFVSSVDSKGERGNDIEFLSHQLTDSLKTDSLKVRAIYYWMTQNMSFDPKKLSRNKTESFRGNKKNKDLVEKFDWEKARTSLVTKVGGTSDNAILFSYLCLFAGIECKMLETFGVNNYRKLNSLKEEKEDAHVWNAILINSKWYIIDITRSGGYYDKTEKKYVRLLNEFYYLTSPDDLIYVSARKSKSFTVKSNAVVLKAEISTLSGEKVYTKKIKSMKAVIDNDKLKKGAYLLKLFANSGVVMKKLIIEN